MTPISSCRPARSNLAATATQCVPFGDGSGAQLQQQQRAESNEPMSTAMACFHQRPKSPCHLRRLGNGCLFCLRSTITSATTASTTVCSAEWRAVISRMFLDIVRCFSELGATRRACPSLLFSSSRSWWHWLLPAGTAAVARRIGMLIFGQSRRLESSKLLRPHKFGSTGGEDFPGNHHWHQLIYDTALCLLM